MVYVRMCVCFAVNHIKMNEPIGLIFCSEIVNISEKTKAYSHFDILLLFKMLFFIMKSLPSSPKGFYLINPLYKENGTSDQKSDDLFQRAH